MHPRKKEVLDILGKEPENLDELANGVIKIIETFPDHDYFSRAKRKVVNNIKVVGFKWKVDWSSSVSNSHSHPLDGVKNWSSRDPSLPTGYPGFSGRVWIRYKDYPRGFGSDPFRKTLTYTGTGGYGGYSGPWEAVSSARWNRYEHSKSKNQYPEISCFSWYYRFYQSDWPCISEELDSARIIAELKNEPVETRHVFEWNDAETQIADAAFIAECATIKAKGRS